MLQEELLRLQSVSWHEALRLPPDASKAQIRAAFLRDTKQFHPNRFARRTRHIARLANEVFLLLKSAYYGLSGTGRRGARSNRVPSSSPTSSSREIPSSRRAQDALRSPPSKHHSLQGGARKSPQPRKTVPTSERVSSKGPGSQPGMRVPPRTSTQGGGRGPGSKPGMRVPPRASTQGGGRGPGSQPGMRVPPRTSTQGGGRGPGSQPGMRVPPRTSTQGEGRGPGSKPGMRVPPRRPGSQPGLQQTPPSSQDARRRAPTSTGRNPVARDTSGRYSASNVSSSRSRRATTSSDARRSDTDRVSSRGPRAITNTGQSHATGNAQVPSSRAGQSPRKRAPSSPRMSNPGEVEVAEGLVRALQLGESGKWGDAMAVLQQLFKSHPDDRRIQAYAHFIRGREYDNVNNVSNARAEYQRALAIDPSLDAAHRAMNGLRSRRKPSVTPSKDRK